MNPRHAFTLIEMLIATVLAAILTAGVLTMSAALARDQQRLAERSRVDTSGIVELFRFDLANARSIAQATDGQVIVLVGHGGIDRRTLVPTNRLTRVVYRVEPDTSALTRTQEYVDDPARAQQWSELVAADVARIELASASGDVAPVVEPLLGSAVALRRIGDVRLAPVVPDATTIPSSVRLRLASRSNPIDQEIRTR